MIQARANIPNMAPPTLERMIRVADLETRGYGSLRGSNLVVYIVVIVVASGMFFYIPSGTHDRASWVSPVRVHLFFPLPSFLSSSFLLV